jgi:molybdopterin biosynthesis enzyme
VVRRPVVAILATGNELTAPGEPLADGKIYNSNTYSIAAQVVRDGGIPGCWESLWITKSRWSVKSAGTGR